MNIGKKAIYIGVAVVIGILLTSLFMRVVLFPAHVADKAMDTAEGVVDQTLNANNALFNYENFKDLYNGAKAQKANIENTLKKMDDLKEMYGEPTEWTKDIREEHSFMKDTLSGYEMQYQSLVKEYNSDSSKLNRNLFKDNNLPEELPLDYSEIQ